MSDIFLGVKIDGVVYVRAEEVRALCERLDLFKAALENIGENAFSDIDDDTIWMDDDTPLGQFVDMILGREFQ